jgi:hypothetical protein
VALCDWMNEAHVGIVLVDTGDCEIGSTLLIVLVWDERIGVDIAMDDFETIFIGDAVSVPECCGWVDETGHIMEQAEEQALENNGKARRDGN